MQTLTNNKTQIARLAALPVDYRRELVLDAINSMIEIGVAKSVEDFNVGAMVAYLGRFGRFKTIYN